MQEELLFLDRNLDTSQPSGPRDPAPPLLRTAQAGPGPAQLRLKSAQVCSGLLQLVSISVENLYILVTIDRSF
jgi:hypothetical protein